MNQPNAHARFQDWLSNPVESPEFEVKSWLDWSGQSARGTIAKALIALENHGGGFLLIGYTEDSEGRMTPNPQRPPDLRAYQADAINAVLEKCAVPSFHVSVTYARHPDTGEEYPVIQVPGTSLVPVRSGSATACNTLKENMYYIRRPGPKSEPPATGAEWDALLRRCLEKQRHQVVETLKGYLPLFYSMLNSGSDMRASASQRKISARLDNFCDKSHARWTELNDALPVEHRAKITAGTYISACRINGQSRQLSTTELREALHGLRKYTGWSALLSLSNNAKPYLFDGCLEASLIDIQNPDPAHADFWRICPDGLVYLLRGYAEDVPAGGLTSMQRASREFFDLTIPVWRVAEFLLRVAELASVMYEPGFSLEVHFEWNGLNGRRLFSYGGKRWVPDEHVCRAAVVMSSIELSADAVRDMLPEIARQILQSLYEHFDFMVPTELYAEEISKLKSGA